MATKYWTSTIARNWTTTAAWSGSSVPVEGDDVIFNGSGGATGTCTVTAETNQINTLTVTSGFPSLGIVLNNQAIRLTPDDSSANNPINVYSGFIFSTIRAGTLKLYDKHMSNSGTITQNIPLYCSGPSGQFVIVPGFYTVRGTTFNINNIYGFGFFPSIGSLGGIVNYLGDTFSGAFISNGASTIIANSTVNFSCSSITVGSYDLNATQTVNAPNLTGIIIVGKYKAQPNCALRLSNYSNNLNIVYRPTFCGTRAVLYSNVPINNLYINAPYTLNTNKQLMIQTYTLQVSGNIQIDSVVLFDYSTMMPLEFIGSNQTLSLNCDLIYKFKMNTPGQIVNLDLNDNTLALSLDQNSNYIGGSSSGPVTIRSINSTKQIINPYVSQTWNYVNFGGILNIGQPIYCNYSTCTNLGNISNVTYGLQKNKNIKRSSTTNYPQRNITEMWKNVLRRR